MSTLKLLEIKFLSVLFSIILASLLSTSVASAKVVFGKDADLTRRLNAPIHEWRDDSVTPRAVVMAIHGLTLHGTCFDSFARHLAAQGMIVVAPDLRGYGEWFESNRHARISYSDSVRDLTALAFALRAKYRHLPLFCSGESLGGSMSIRLAASEPELFSGLILSAPGIKISHSVPFKTVLSSLAVLIDPWHRINLSPYLDRCMPGQQSAEWQASEDDQVRMRLSAVELQSSCHFVDDTVRYISQVPANMPVLILQGKLDRVVSLDGTRLLERLLKSTDQTVTILQNDGHILLERQDIPEQAISTVTSWLDEHCARLKADASVSKSSSTLGST